MTGQDISEHFIRQGEVEWDEVDGRIKLRRPKFGSFGTRVLRLFRINPILTLKLDAIGTAAWHLMDGRTVNAVLDALEDQFPQEGRLAERFGLYVQRLVSMGAVQLQSASKTLE